MQFKLRFPETEIEAWSAKYNYDDSVPVEIAPRARARGYLTKPEFIAIARWKTARSGPKCAKNAESFVEAVTSTALGAADERLKIEVLTLLSGVHWPTASVFLHFCSADRYPIVDFRALWSLKCDVTASDYDFEFWEQYCAATRKIAERAAVSMRTLDRALWQYSSERQ